jgi:hypothetical protein
LVRIQFTRAEDDLIAVDAAIGRVAIGPLRISERKEDYASLIPFTAEVDDSDLLGQGLSSLSHNGLWQAYFESRCQTIGEELLGVRF